MVNSRRMSSALCLMLLGVALTHGYPNDTTYEQLLVYKESTTGPIGRLQTSSGAPVFYEDTKTINSDLLLNEFFLDTLLHLNRERIPERVVHANGAGAFGYFEVTNDITNICKANLFSLVGKRTPVTVRFSPTFTDRGGADTNRESRGFAVKFYTNEGNFDLVMVDIEMFNLKDPILFRTHVHVNKRNPKTNVINDANMLWDFVTLRPENVHHIIPVFADRGIPNGYRHMPGFAIHVYELVNDNEDPTFVKFHMLPDLGIETLFSNDAIRLAGEDPDYATKDLYTAIDNGDFPSWTLYIQVMTIADFKNVNFDASDITLVWPSDQFPLKPVGRMVLNRNPSNHFADIEQAAFCPGNLVPGILGGVDKVFEARRLAYRDAQNYRLGVNFNKIAVNCPLQRALTYNRDGHAPVRYNGEDAPNYYPNSFNGPVPSIHRRRTLTSVYTNPNATNFGQAGDLYRSYPEDEQQRLADNIVNSVKKAATFIQERVVNLFTAVDQKLGDSIAQGLLTAANMDMSR